MADAAGRLPGGVLEGTVMDFGSFTECLKIRVKKSSEEKESFRGRYCMVQYSLPLLSSLQEKTSSGENYTDLDGVPPNWVNLLRTSAGKYISQTGIWLGICVPSSCLEDDVKEILTSVTKPLGMSVKVDKCEADEPKVWRTSSLIAVILLCLILGMCTLGTILDVILRYRVEESQCTEPKYVLFHIFRAFSVYSNTENLFASATGSGTLSCFHGIRFFSAVWIILGHTYYYASIWYRKQFSDALLIYDYFNNFLPNAVLENFSVAAETFFFMSGYLLVHGTWKKLEKSDGKLNFLTFFVSKYFRMTPTLAAGILLLFVVPIIGSNPLRNSFIDPLVSSCEGYWWANLLYINDFFSNDKQCFPHSWYLAVLMQLHIIGTVLLLLSFRRPYLGVFLGFSAVVVCIVETATISTLDNFLMPTTKENEDADLFGAYNVKIYVKPFCHAPCYLIGMGCAFLVKKFEDKQIGKGYQVLGWCLAIMVALSSEYGVYGPAESVGIRAFYISCYRIGWSLCIGWLTFACITGRGGIVNRLLSWNAFIPLGQLSFVVYLIQPLVIYYAMGSARERISYGHIQLVLCFLAYTVIAFFAAYIGHVTVEKPFQILEGILFRNRSDNVKMMHAKEPQLTSHTATIPA